MLSSRMPGSSTKEAEKSQEIATHRDVLLNRLREIRSDGQYTDFTICCEFREIKAHKVVLATASAYFHAMFAHDTLETRKNRLHLHDFELEVLELVVDYMYMCKIDLDEDNLEPVLKVAHYFQVESLGRLCTQHMFDGLSSKNCLRLMQLAKDINLINLEQKAFRHALKNFEDVVDDRHFLKIEFDLLSCLIESDDLQVRDEFQVFEAILTWILADEAARKLFLPELIKLVRLTFIHPQKLANLTCCELIWDSLECQRYLNAAKDYCLSGNTDTWGPPADRMCRLNTKPRRPMCHPESHGGRALGGASPCGCCGEHEPWPSHQIIYQKRDYLV